MVALSLNLSSGSVKLLVMLIVGGFPASILIELCVNCLIPVSSNISSVVIFLQKVYPEMNGI